MKFRITVRGEGLELRGYLTALTPGFLPDFADAMEPYGIVVASTVDSTYDPFREGWETGLISEPQHPPTIEASTEHIERLIDLADGDMHALLEMLANLHLAQARVIRGERYLREQAEAELRDRELHHAETEQINERLEAELRQLRG
jgi:hypothetical protein